MTRKTPSSGDGSSNKTLALLIGTTCGIVAAPSISFAGPAGGVVTGGQGNISTPTSTSTVIDQSSNRLSIDWQSFDVAANESVSFRQPSSNSVALNRILDQKASEVFGRIDANGRVVLFNSNGILFGPGSQVNVGSLVATSLNVVSFDESTGQLRLSAAGSPGSIVNSGSISAAPGGSVSLVGGAVANNGLIVADLGAVNLAAGRSATIDLYGGGLLRFEADSSLTSNSSGAAAGVNNAGQIVADGGQVLLTTSAVQNVFDRAVNNDGLVRASRIDNSGGSIRLVGAGGTVINSGVLDASGTGAASTGGEVQVLGQNVGLFGNARVDVSGDAGGGTALIGGDYQGANPDVLNANQTIVGPDAQILANARVAGDGGRVILWSDEATRYYGGISARGGATSGDGGFAEVSSHGVLLFDGRVNLGAPAGAAGQLLLDPENITIEDGGPDTDVTLDFGDPPADASIDADAIEDALDTASVILRATDDIVVDEAITGAGANRGITLRAGDDIEINANITTNNGAILLSAHDSGGGVTFPPVNPDGTGDVTFGSAATTLNTGTAAITITSEGTLALGTLSGGVIDLTSETGNITNAGATLTGSSLSLTAASATLNTTIGTLTSALTTGALTLTDSNGLIVNNASGNGVNITATGDLTVGMVSAGAGTATLTSLNGAILDDNTATAIAGANVALDAETGIGTVTNLRNGTGSTVDVNTAGALTATVAAPGGQINLDFGPLIPTIAAGDIDLGGINPATGTILLQAAGDFDVAAAFAAGAIDLGVGNTAQVGLRSGGLLTLPNNTTGIFDAAPDTLVVTGTNIVDDGGAAGLAFAVDNLIFDSGANSVNQLLNTDVDQLTATLGNNADLTVVETDGINLTSITARNIDVTSSGPTVIGALNANTTVGTVTLASGGGAISDAVGATPSVVANQLTITAAGTADLDTNVNILDASGVTGPLTIREQSGNLAVTSASATGPVNLSAAGALTLAANAVNAGANTVTLNAGAAITDAVGTTPSVIANQLTITGATSADLDTNVNTLNASGVTGALTIRDQNAGLAVTASATGAINVSTTGGTMAVATVNAGANTATLTSTGGAMTLGTVTAGGGVNLTTTGGGNGISLGTVTTNAGTGTVTLAAGGAILDAGGAVPSVVANQLTITGATAADLDTNVNTLNASGITGTLNIRDQVADLAVANATAGGAINLSAAGALTLAANAVNAGANTVTLNAGAAITDAVGTTPSVIANQLTITGATSADLDTNVNTLNASGVTGALTIRDQNTGLAVTASATGAINVSTTGGTMAVTSVNAGANTATLTSTGGAMTLGTVTAGGGVNLTTTGGGNGITLGTVTTNAGTGTVTLAAGGAIADAGGNVPSVVANQLTITGATSADLDTNVNTLNASGIAGTLIIRDQVADLAVTNASAGGPVNILTAAGGLNVTNAAGNGVTLTAGGAASDLTVATVNAGAGAATLIAGRAILDDDTGTSSATRISGGSIALTAVTGIGTVTDFEAAAGLSVDVNTVGTLTANVTAPPPSGAINLNISGNPAIGPNGILFGSGSGRAGTVLLQSANALNLQFLDPLAISIGSSNDVSVGYVSGALLTLPGGGGPTDFAPRNLLVSGADIVQQGAPVGTITLAADSLVFNASAPANAFQLNTTVGTLQADVGGVGLSVDQSAGTITLGDIVAQTIDVQADGAGGAILDDGDDSTELTAQSVALGSIGAIGSVANAIDVDTVDLTAFSGTGDVAINSVGTASTRVALTAGNALPAAGNGNISLTAAGDVRVAQLLASQDTVNVTTAGQLINDASIPVVTAGQLVIGGASAVDLGVDIDTLTATGVTGNLNVTETGGSLTVTNVNATGAVNVASIAGALDVASATGSNVTLSATTNIALGTVNANPTTGTVSLLAGGAIADAAGTTPSVVANQLTITGASSVDLDTNVNTLNATGLGGPLTIREQAGDLTVANASSSVGAVTLTSVAGALNNVNAAGASVTLNASTNISLAAVNAGAGTVALAAGGAITDAAGATPSVVGGQLLIANAGSADLDTNVNTLDASAVTGALSIREQTGALAVTNATAGGAVNVSTVAGAMTVTNATGNGVTLTAGGAGNGLTLGSVNAGANTATLAAGGAIADAAGATPSVVANQLTITTAGSADLDTNVNILSANGVTGALSVREQSGALTVANASSTGAVDVSTVAGAMTVTTATGNGVTLNAGGAGSGLTLGAVNAGAGTATLAAGGAISDAAGATPSVVASQLAITAAASADLDTNVNTLNASGVTGTLTIREQSGDLAVANASAGAVNVSTAGALTLGAVNAGAGTATLTAGGAITDAAGATPSVVANQLTIAGAASADLDTDVSTLSASGVTGALTIRQLTGNLAVANASSAGAVNISTAGGALTVTTATGSGIALNAGTDLTLGTVNAGAGTTTLAAGGAITDAAGATPSVVANLLTITGAGSADLDTNVNTLNASGVVGALSIREQTGALSVANASATGAVNVSTVSGNLNVTEAASSGGALTLTAGGTGALTVASSTASGASATLTSGGDMTLGTVNATAGAATLTSGGRLTLGTVNSTGTATLAAAGAISDAAGATPSVVANQLTITGAASADLDTNVNTLNASGVTGALSIREQSGALAVTNASSTGAVNVSTIAGALNVTNATGSAVTLAAGGAGNGLTLGAVNAGAGTATMTAGGAISDAAGATPSVVANQLTVTAATSVDLDTNVNTLNASGVTGALSVREQTGALTVANASSSAAVNLSTVAGALNVTNASGNAITLNAGGAGSGITLGTVTAGTGNASLTASGAITDGTTGTALTAGNANITAGSIGSAANTLDTAISSLTATSTSGGMYFREAGSVALTSLTGAAGQDVVVGATGDLTVGQIGFSGTGNGRVLLAAGNNIQADGSVTGPHITAQNVELRAGGLNAAGGAIGASNSLLRMSVPQSIAGGGGTTVPSVLLLQNQSATDPSVAAQTNQIATVGDIQISAATFNPATQNAQTFLTTTFSTRTAQGDGVRVENADFFSLAGQGGFTGTNAVNTLAAANANAVLTNATAVNAQGEGTLYIDWASFDPNVSLFGTMNPPVCLPSDQSEEDAEPADPAAAATATADGSGGCASTTAQYDGSFRMPQVKLVITSRGVEWVTTPSGKVSVFPLIGQLR